MTFALTVKCCLCTSGTDICYTHGSVMRYETERSANVPPRLIQRLLTIVPLIFLTGGTMSAQTIRVLSDRPFPDAAAKALDIRWASDESVDVTTMNRGVLRVPVNGAMEASAEAFAPAQGSCPTCSVLAVSKTFIATAFHVGQIAWTQRGAGQAYPFPFDAIVDLDLQGDRLLILGSRRDNTGAWAPDGAIAWIGTLGKKLADLRPVHYSTSGPEAMVYGRCGFLNAGGGALFPRRFVRRGPWSRAWGVSLRPRGKAVTRLADGQTGHPRSLRAFGRREQTLPAEPRGPLWMAESSTNCRRSAAALRRACSSGSGSAKGSDPLEHAHSQKAGRTGPHRATVPITLGSRVAEG
jgi:hypothetical protein